MIVCSCNLLTDTAVRDALAVDPNLDRVRDVYDACGVKPKCGGCAASINRLIQEAERERETEAAQNRRDAA